MTSTGIEFYSTRVLIRDPVDVVCGRYPARLHSIEATFVVHKNLVVCWNKENGEYINSYVPKKHKPV